MSVDRKLNPLYARVRNFPWPCLVPWNCVIGGYLFVLLFGWLGVKLHIGKPDNAYLQSFCLLLLLLACRQVWLVMTRYIRSRGRLLLASLILTAGYILFALSGLFYIYPNLGRPSEVVYSVLFFGGIIGMIAGLIIGRGCLTASCSLPDNKQQNLS